MPLRYVGQGGWGLIDFTLAPDQSEGAASFGAWTNGMHDCIPIVVVATDVQGEIIPRAAFCHLDLPSRLDLAEGIFNWLTDGQIDCSVDIFTTVAEDGKAVAAQAAFNPLSAANVRLIGLSDGNQEQFGVSILPADAPAQDNANRREMSNGRTFVLEDQTAIDERIARDNAEANQNAPATWEMDYPNPGGQPAARDQRVAEHGLGQDAEGNLQPAADRPGYIVTIGDAYYLPADNALAPAEIANAGGADPGPDQGGGQGQPDVPGGGGGVDPVQPDNPDQPNPIDP